MNLQALLFSADNAASDVLGRVLPSYGVAVERLSDPVAAVMRLQQQRFDALVVDFENSDEAASVVDMARQAGSGLGALMVALLDDVSRVREILAGGAQFVLYKPLTEDTARGGLRAFAALLSRERRRAVRVPVQAPVELTLPDKRVIEGILLDLSETGMDVLTAAPLGAGTLLGFRFQLPSGGPSLEAHGQIAWANPNGQTGVHFLDVAESHKAQLKAWVKSAQAFTGQEEYVPHCQLTDLSLGGCYVETASPFPEKSSVDLCLAADEMEVHTKGIVRVVHPGYGMGVEFASRTAEQRAQVANLITVLKSNPESSLDLLVSPVARVADESDFGGSASDDDMEDPLLDLLRNGASHSEDEFLAQLQDQRGAERVER